MACNLCHEVNGHKDTCSTQIRVEWESSGSIWETLGRRLFDEFADAERDRIATLGSSTSEHELDMFVRNCRQALDDGDPYTVLELLRIRRG